MLAKELVRQLVYPPTLPFVPRRATKSRVVPLRLGTLWARAAGIVHMGNSYSDDAKGARQVGLEKWLPTRYKDRLVTRRAERNADRSMPLVAPTATTLGFALGGADPSAVLPGPAQTLLARAVDVGPCF